MVMMIDDDDESIQSNWQTPLFWTGFAELPFHQSAIGAHPTADAATPELSKKNQTASPSDTHTHSHPYECIPTHTYASAQTIKYLIVVVVVVLHINLTLRS